MEAGQQRKNLIFKYVFVMSQYPAHLHISPYSVCSTLVPPIHAVSVLPFERATIQDNQSGNLHTSFLKTQ